MVLMHSDLDGQVIWPDAHSSMSKIHQWNQTIEVIFRSTKNKEVFRWERLTCWETDQATNGIFTVYNEKEWNNYKVIPCYPTLLKQGKIINRYVTGKLEEIPGRKQLKFLISGPEQLNKKSLFKRLFTNIKCTTLSRSFDEPPKLPLNRKMCDTEEFETAF